MTDKSSGMYRLRRPPPERLAWRLESLAAAPWSYPEVGRTGGADLPAGYRHLRHRVRLGHGDAVMAAAGDAVLGWELHRQAGLLVAPSTPRAEPGTVVLVGLRLAAVWTLVPCRVAWAVDQPDRRGFAYGTLPGHHERGEEAFVVERAEDGSVWLAITAFSRPASPLARRLAGLARAQQRRVTRAYLDALRPG